MNNGGKEFNRSGLTGLRVLSLHQDCYGAVGIIHSV
jgi:hypothetical protein